MIDQGLVQLVQTNNAVLDLCPAGGFMTQLPENFSAFPSWTWKGFSLTPGLTLRSFKGLYRKRWQLDVFGSAAAQGADCIALAIAIDAVLNGFTGTLSDPDSTWVNEITLSDQEDFFNDSARNYRRMLEYEIHYAQT